MSDRIFIQRCFTEEKDGIRLDDAIILLDVDYGKLSEEQIVVIKKERLDKFVDSIQHPPVKVEPTKSEKIASLDKDIAALDEQKAALVSLKAEINSK